MTRVCVDDQPTARNMPASPTAWAAPSRQAQLEFEIERPPAAPTAADLTEVTGHIREILRDGGHREKKALFDALIHEIKIQSDDSLIPVFRVPTVEHNAKELADQRPAPDQSAVRTLPRIVDRTRRCANHAS